MKEACNMKKVFAISGMILLLFAACSPAQEEIIISDFDGDRASYAAPSAGECLFFVEVEQAREHYAGQPVKFLLALDIFKADGTLSDMERTAEYRRLKELGYELYQTQKWEYKSENEKVYHDIVVWLFDEQQLADFKANPDYGYSFYFGHNGDGSNIEI